MTDEQEIEFVEADPIMMPTENGAILIFDPGAIAEALGIEAVLGFQTAGATLFALTPRLQWVKVEEAKEGKVKGLPRAN